MEYSTIVWFHVTSFRSDAREFFKISFNTLGGVETKRMRGKALYSE